MDKNKAKVLLLFLAIPFLVFLIWKVLGIFPIQAQPEQQTQLEKEQNPNSNRNPNVAESDPSETNPPKLDSQRELISEESLPVDAGNGRQRLLPSLSLSAPGSPTWAGKARFIAISPELVEALENEIAMTYALIQTLTEISEVEVQGPELPLPEFHDQGEFFGVWMVPGYYAQGQFWKTPIPEQEQQIRLKPAEPLVVKAVNAKGEPIPGVSVKFWNYANDPNYASLPWRERLERKYFEETLETGTDGLASLTYPLEGPMTVGVEAGSVYAPSLLLEAKPGQENVMVLYPACSARGRVVDPDGNYVPNSWVSFMARTRQGQARGMGDYPVQSNGEYHAESVSTGADGIMAIAFAQGYALSMQAIPRPEAGREYAMDFVLHPGGESRFQLLGPNEEPMAGLLVQFSASGRDWVPGAFQSDPQGRFQGSTFLARGKSYWMKIQSGPFLLDTQAIQIPESGFLEQTLRCDSAGYWNQVELWLGTEPQALAECAWIPDGSGKRLSWVADQRSPWLPVGQGFLHLKTEAGPSFSASTALRPGDNQTAVIKLTTAKVRAMLPAPGASPWEVHGFDARGGVLGQFKDLGEGEHHWSLPTGKIRLALMQGGETLASFGPYRLASEGLDLGLLSPAPSTDLRGRLVDGEGHPWRDLTVQLSGEAGGLRQTHSQADGSFQFTRLAPGDYELQVLPFTQLLQAPDLRFPILIEGAEGSQELELTIRAGETVEVQLQPRPSQAWSGWLRRPQHWESVQVSTSGKLQFHAGTDALWYGAVARKPGEFYLAGQFGAPPTQEAQIQISPLNHRRLRFLQADGSPQEQARCWISLDRYRLPVAGQLDHNGRLDLAVPKDESRYGFWLESESGSLHYVAVADLPKEGDWQWPQSPVAMQLQIQDLQGQPLPAVMIRSLQEPLWGMTDQNGNSSWTLVQPNRPLRAMKAGYWPVQWLPRETSTATLRRPAKPLLVEIHPQLAPVDLRLQAEFDLGYSWQVPEFQSADRPRHFRLQGVPEGAYRLIASRDGEVVLERPLDLSAEETNSVRLAKP
ncbi:MAG: carboxypeptidase regulatory-like domain-containing protein [Planctomycetota bacterium]|nr:MAG: carboxypeptidase regulatory-like domain-containing protein [Planctomycetota bacterium]